MFKRLTLLFLMAFLLIGCQKEQDKITVYDGDKNELYILEEKETISYFKDIMKIATDFDEKGKNENVLENPERESEYDVLYHYFVELDINGEKTKSSITVFNDHPFVAFDYLPNLPMINLILTEEYQEPLYHPENFK